METGSMIKDYHHSHFREDSRREILWKALWKYYFKYHIQSNDCVLDIGSGYGNFINNVEARNRIAIDIWPDFRAHIKPGIQTIVGNVTDLSQVKDASIDVAFASNVFEHIAKNDFSEFLSSLKKKLSHRGQLIILQPNYRYCASEYFDDYTHISIWSHISLTNFLVANDYIVTQIHPRFLPLTIKSKIPVHPYLIGLYLMLPFKPMGKQMLLFAKPK